MHTNLSICRPQTAVGAHHVIGGAAYWPRPATSGPLKSYISASKVFQIDQCSTFVEASRRASSEIRGDGVVF